MGEIQTLTNPDQWRHVPSEQNPTDMVTRGTTVSTLSSMRLWWHGPRFLEQDESSWPISEIPSEEAFHEEQKNNRNLKRISAEPKKASNKDNVVCETVMTTVKPWSNRCNNVMQLCCVNMLQPFDHLVT